MTTGDQCRGLSRGARLRLAKQKRVQPPSQYVEVYVLSRQNVFKDFIDADGGDILILPTSPIGFAFTTLTSRRERSRNDEVIHEQKYEITPE